MKIKTTLLALTPLALAMAAPSAMAASQGSEILFTGSVVDAACDLVPSSEDQQIPLGQLSMTNLNGGATSSPELFSIELENCDPAKTVSVAFTGTTVSGDTTLLATGGVNTTADGVAIQIADSSNTTLNLDGTAGTANAMIAGTNKLDFTAWAIAADPATTPVTEGTFEGSVNFVLTYN